MSDKKETPLRRALWSRQGIEGGLDGLLEVVATAPDEHWNGLALTTSGPVALVRVSENRLYDSAGKALPREGVYELRLWATHTDEPARDRLLARELRWLNGSGAVDVQVSAAGQHGEECWYRLGEYLQHQPAAAKETGGPKVMSVVEVFEEESLYGNTVFVDELFTGRWA